MSDSRPVLLIGQPLLAALLPILRPLYDAWPLWEGEGEGRRDKARAIVWAGEFPLASALLDIMPQLGLIACFSVGYDGVDVMEADRRGIVVTNGADANAEDVADHAIGLMLAHRRGIVEGDRLLRAGLWKAGPERLSLSMAGARLGIVGLGHIGQAVARRADAMRMQINWWGPRDKPALPWARSESLKALARDSDILLVAARADGGNRGMIDAGVMDALGPGGLLVNVARGQLVDEPALRLALRQRTLGGAALDVFQQEPTPAQGWTDVPNCVLTPHMAGATHEAVSRMTALLLANLEAFFAGEALPNRVRPD